MSPQIHEEVTLLLMSMYGGLVLILCYDGMRIFRRIFSASIYRVIIEDIIFWSIASIFMFDIFLKYNYGRPRYYAIGATLGVMALYEWLIGRRIVDKLSSILKKIVKTLLKPLKKAAKVVKLKGNRFVNYIRKKVIKCLHKEKHSKVHQGEHGRMRKKEHIKVRREERNKALREERSKGRKEE